MIRGIECELNSDMIYSFLTFITQEQYNYYVPWCLKSEKNKLLPQFSEHVFLSSHDIYNYFSTHGLFELVLHIYPQDTQFKTIETYDDFLHSDCLCCLIYYDCGFLDIYIKDHLLFTRIWSFLDANAAENMGVITDENEGRTAIHP